MMKVKFFHETPGNVLGFGQNPHFNLEKYDIDSQNTLTCKWDVLKIAAKKEKS